MSVFIYTYVYINMCNIDIHIYIQDYLSSLEGQHYLMSGGLSSHKPWHQMKAAAKLLYMTENMLGVPDSLLQEEQ